MHSYFVDTQKSRACFLRILEYLKLQSYSSIKCLAISEFVRSSSHSSSHSAFIRRCAMAGFEMTSQMDILYETPAIQHKRGLVLDTRFPLGAAPGIRLVWISMHIIM